MPRTGTTLVERILGSHPPVFSAGELNHFSLELIPLVQQTAGAKRLSRLEFVAASARVDFRALGQAYMAATRPLRDARPHFIDKLPFNFLYAGLIHLALPKAKIVNLQRHPMDTCYAVYKQLFRDAYPFSYDLQRAGPVLRRLPSADAALACRHAGRHPHDPVRGAGRRPRGRGPAPARALRAALGRRSACVSTRAEQASTTASALQVREPVYTRSVGKWRHLRTAAGAAAPAARSRRHRHDMTRTARIPRAAAPDGLVACVLLAFLATAGLFYVNIMPALVAGLIDGLGFSNREAGFVGSANVYGAACGALIAVFLVRRLPWRRMQWFALSLLLALDLVSTLVTEATPLIALRFLHGIVGGISVGTGLAVMARTTIPDRAFGMLLTVQYGAGGLGIMFLPALREDHGPEVLFLALAGFTAVTLAMLPFLADYPPKAAVRRRLRAVGGVAARLPLVLTLVAIFLFQAANMGAQRIRHSARKALRARRRLHQQHDWRRELDRSHRRSRRDLDGGPLQPDGAGHLGPAVVVRGSRGIPAERRAGRVHRRQYGHGDRHGRS